MNKAQKRKFIEGLKSGDIFEVYSETNSHLAFVPNSSLPSLYIPSKTNIQILFIRHIERTGLWHDKALFDIEGYFIHDKVYGFIAISQESFTGQKIS